MSQSDGYPPISDYAIIGDCHTAALVSKAGSIDWYCPERFDAPAVFCRLLDKDRGGFLSVAPVEPFTSSRRYRPGTNVLETTFRVGSGTVRLTDFMAIHRRSGSRLGADVGTSRQILRLVEAASEPCAGEVRFKPTFDFARADTPLSIVSGKGAVGRAAQQALVLYSAKVDDLSADCGEARGTLHLRPGEHAWLVLSLASNERGIEDALDVNVSVRDLERTAEYWLDWSATSQYGGRYGDAVLRSALVLKLLTYEPTGAVVAAPTTSLPEQLGGVRNWDYRFTWLRDASLMLYALSTLGYHEEATDFISFLARNACVNSMEAPQIMYRIDGSRDLPERTLDHLGGYKGSRPVRTGNEASNQHQLDIFGDVLSASYHFRHAIEDHPSTPTPLPHERLAHRNWGLLTALVEQAAASWQKPDSGIWEVRGGPRHFVYSKLMCWTALDRGIRLAQEERLPAPLERWHTIREEIRATILRRGYNAKLGAFTQALDGDELDASVLAIPRFGFLPATDPRVQSTVERIGEHLTRHGLVERYHAEDGLPGSEATFALCSFWMVDALALGGRQDEARELFERLLSYTNDVGLLSEEIEPESPTDKLLGNFPQGFSHMALIGSAVNLAKANLQGAEQYPRTEPERAAEVRQAVGG